MKRYDRVTPEGTKDLLYAECSMQKSIINTLNNLFESEGYHQVITPGFEFYDVFSSGNMYFPQENMYKLIDDKGRIMVARPDSTIPIARLTATRLKGCRLPLKLYYGQTIYRKNPGLQGRRNEIMQIGIEHIGESSFQVDVDIVMLGASALHECGADNFRLEIGNVGIFKFLMNNLDVDRDDKAKIHEYIAAKNYAALSAKLDRLEYAGGGCGKNKDSVRLLRELPSLFGGREVFNKAFGLFQGCDDRILHMLDGLLNLYSALEENGLGDNIIIDFGLVNQADYYNSLVFRGYMESVGEAVLSGGRYDGLLKEFGVDLPAIGFGINADLLVSSKLKTAAADGESPLRENRLRIALTKGRLEKDAVELFKSMGFDCSGLRDKGRKLFLSIPESELDVVFAKAADVITYVEHGVCDLGIVGMDTILEYGGVFYEILNLGFGACRFVLAVPEGKDFYNGYSTKRVATKYPNVTRAYFEEQGMDVEIIRIEGSVELAPILSLADGIIDIAATGTTLKENGLMVAEEITDISARLIVNEASMKLKKNAIDSLIKQMEKEGQV